jgi:oligopeptide/dipeptide ABC transporter ATP-binding protein
VTPLLDVRQLTVTLPGRDADTALVRGIDLRLNAGETVALVGESGSGKSLTVMAMMGLLPTGLRTGGSIEFDGTDLTSLSESAMRGIRGRDIAMVYQDPMTSLNPYHRIGAQIAEGMTAHGVSPADARQRTLELLDRVGIPDPVRTTRAYPHEFSGGMRQRVMIAMALAMRPRLLFADEPTTALDVTIQQQILALVAELRTELGMATVWVTHDLGVVARLVDRVLVMYAGRIVEDAPVRQIFAAPQHPYTAQLLASLPNPTDDERGDLAQIPGRPPDPADLPTGCSFRPRCPQAREICAAEPALQPRGGGVAACHVPPAHWRPSDVVVAGC